MQATAQCMRGVGSLIGVNPVGRTWIQERIGSLFAAPRAGLDGEGSWQTLRQAVVTRVAAHSHAKMLSCDDLEDIVGEVLVRAAPALLAGGQRVRHPSAFLSKVVANQFHQTLRKSGPVWTRLKDEVVDIARGRRGDHGLVLWHRDGVALIGLSDWRDGSIVATDAYLQSLQRTRLRRKSLYRYGLYPHLDTPTLLRALLTYLGTPIPLSHAVALLFDLRRLQDLRRVSLEELSASRAELPAPGNLEHDSETDQTVLEIARACEHLDDDRLAALVLHLEVETAACLISAASARLESRIWQLFSCAFPPDGQRALRELPLSDKQIADLIGRAGSGQREAQICISNLRRSAQRKISRTVLAAPEVMAGQADMEVRRD